MKTRGFRTLRVLPPGGSNAIGKTRKTQKVPYRTFLTPVKQKNGFGFPKPLKLVVLVLKGNLFLTCKYIITRPRGFFITKVLQTHQMLIKFQFNICIFYKISAVLCICALSHTA